MKARTALVTGASSGIGRATASVLAAKGYRVYGTSRNPDTIPAAARIAAVSYVPLELGDAESARSCVEQIGHIDVLVNNAGESQAGPLEELPDEALERLFALNVLGPVRLTQLVLPSMRLHHYGRVIMVGSMLASFPLAHRSSYAASKAAVKAFASAARGETEPFGVKLVTVEPGSINTGLSQRRTKYLHSGSVYRDQFTTVISRLERNESRGIAPEMVAQTITRAIESNRPRYLYAVGSRAPIAYPIRRLLTDGGTNRLVNAMHGIRR